MEAFKININAIALSRLPRLEIAGVDLLNALALGRDAHGGIFQTKACHEGCRGGRAAS